MLSLKNVLLIVVIVQWILFMWIFEASRKTSATEPPASVSQAPKTRTIFVNQNASCSEPLWMLVVVPTMARKPGTPDYLAQTLDSWLQQLPVESQGSPLFHKIKVLLVDLTHSGSHDHLDAMKQRATREPLLQHYVRFADLSGVAVPPGSQEHAHSVDFARMVGALHSEAPSQLVYFAEDDFPLCPSALDAMLYFVNKATRYNPQWGALRVSYGLNGLLMRRSELAGIPAYFERAVFPRRKPPDHGIYDYVLDVLGRKISTFRYNLAHHIGKVSNFNQGVRAARYTPACYDLLFDWLLENEVFDFKRCPRDDVHPCEGQPVPETLPDWDRTIDNLCLGHFPLCASVAGEQDYPQCKK